MADFPLIETTGIGYVASNVTAGAANVKGAWNEFSASLPYEAVGLWVNYYGTAIANLHLFDIGIGPVGSEKVVIENIHWNQVANMTGMIYFPITIPAGSRLVGRTQSNTAAAVMYLRASLALQGFMPSQLLSSCKTYGADTSDSGGLLIDPGAVADTKGAWVEFSASLPHPISWLSMSLGCMGNTIMSSSYCYLDIGIGPVDSEKVLIPNLRFRTFTTEELHPMCFSLPISIPAGARLVARADSNITDATDRLFDLVLHGAY